MVIPSCMYAYTCSRTDNRLGGGGIGVGAGAQAPSFPSSRLCSVSYPHKELPPLGCGTRSVLSTSGLPLRQSSPCAGRAPLLPFLAGSRETPAILAQERSHPAQKPRYLTEAHRKNLQNEHDGDIQDASRRSTRKIAGKQCMVMYLQSHPDTIDEIGAKDEGAKPNGVKSNLLGLRTKGLPRSVGLDASGYWEPWGRGVKDYAQN